MRLSYIKSVSCNLNGGFMKAGLWNSCLDCRGKLKYLSFSLWWSKLLLMKSVSAIRWN